MADVRRADLSKSSPEDILRWARDSFTPDVALSSSFQTQSLPLLHMVSRVAPDLPVLFIDTGFHFPETLRFRDEVVQAWKLNLRVIRAAEQDFRPGLHAQDPDQCCFRHKVEPMRVAVKGLRAWISGIRRDQTVVRSSVEVVETVDDVVRIHPLASWTARDVWAYVHEHDLPSHPLHARGYLSIGCEPCTRRVHPGEDERAGRWSGSEKTECGLHTELRAPGAAFHTLRRRP